MNRTLAALLGLTIAMGAAALPRDAKIEAAVKTQLARMTLDEKIGQMVQIESNMVALVRPEYSQQALMAMSREQLAETLRRFGLDKKYSAQRLTGGRRQGTCLGRLLFLHSCAGHQR